jgi:ABC-type nitrate/sulfonate/bicarbonate transport system ATPase subunit
MAVSIYTIKKSKMTYQKNEILLQADNIQLSYEGRAVLQDISFSIRNIVRPGIEQGQVISLVGRSGIGKTQLFRILSGLQSPTKGTVTIHGSRQVRAGDMGVVFQDYYLFEWRTVHTSLYMAARQNKTLKGKEKESIAAFAAQFGLETHLQCYPQQLSGGQRQRVSIIQQLLKGSDFLLLDEPFSGLDVCMLDKVTALLQQVSTSAELKTLIIVSHDIITATALSDTVFILAPAATGTGATIKKEIDLIERGLAWVPGVRHKPAFRETVEEIHSLL